MLDEETISQMAEGHGTSNAQVILRWHIQHGHVVVAKTTHRERMDNNLNVFSFELSEPQMAAIDALDKGEAGRIGPNTDSFNWVP